MMARIIHGGNQMTPTLLFLPGAGGDPAFWKPLGSLLPDQWNKTYLGWPGLGHQPPSPAVTSFADLVSMTEAALGHTRCDLLAQSMGGAVALQVALRNPGRVRRIVLTATSGGLDVTSMGAANWRAAYRQDYPQANLSIIEGWPDLTGALPSLDHPVLLLWETAIRSVLWLLDACSHLRSLGRGWKSSAMAATASRRNSLPP